MASIKQTYRILFLLAYNVNNQNVPTQSGRNNNYSNLET